jgi:hypothetical protein
MNFGKLSPDQSFNFKIGIENTDYKIQINF